VAGRSGSPTAAGKTAFRTRIRPQLSSGLECLGGASIPSGLTQPPDRDRRPSLEPMNRSEEHPSDQLQATPPLSSGLRTHGRPDGFRRTDQSAGSTGSHTGRMSSRTRDGGRRGCRAGIQARTWLGLAWNSKARGYCGGLVQRTGARGLHVEDTDPPRRAFDDLAAAGAAGSHVSLTIVDIGRRRVPSRQDRSRSFRGRRSAPLLTNGRSFMSMDEDEDSDELALPPSEAARRNGAITMRSPNASRNATAWPSSSSRCSTFTQACRRG